MTALAAPRTQSSPSAAGVRLVARTALPRNGRGDQDRWTAKR
ncbi:hypothetical protein ACIQV1_18875 [Streptomyces rubiginosohelvolus]